MLKEEIRQAIIVLYNFDVVTGRYVNEELQKEKMIKEIQNAIAAKTTRKQTATRKDTDPDFVQEYNEVLSKVTAIVNTPGVTVQQVKSAFAQLQPVLNTLADSVVRNKYIAQLLEEQNNIIAEINKINQSKDINLIRTNITSTLESTPSLTEGVEKVVVILENSVDPALRQEAIDHFDKEFKRLLDRQVQQLKALATQGTTSKVISKLLESTAKFRDGIISRVAELGTLSEEIAQENSKNGISLAVDTDENFTNPTHRWIVGNINDNVGATAAQRTAIRNLQAAGILSDEDLALLDDEFLVAASELINKGVARIFTIGINKELHRYITLGQKDRRNELISIVSDYLADRDELSKKEADEMATEALDQIDQNKYKIEDVLYTLNIPVTSIISDEQKALLDKQRKIISELLTGSNLLDFITTLDAKQEEVINAGVQEVTASDFLDNNLVRKVAKFIKKDANTSELPLELNEIVDLIRTQAEEKTVTTKINTLVAKYAEKGKPAKIATLKNIFNAIISYSLETESAILNNETSLTPLTDVEMYSVLSGTQMPLNISQVNQIQEFAINTLLEEAKKKFNAVSGYTKNSVDYTPNMLDQPTDFRVKFSILRQKDASDIRTLDELISEFGVQDNKINIREALKTITNSDFATPSEKELAYRLIKLFGEQETIVVNNQLDSLGDYDSETDVVSINLASVAYKEDQPTYPIETLILHELIHKIIEKDAADPSTAFYKQMKSLIEAVKTRPEAKTFYAFQGDLAEDEQVREFAIEALTNPAFQYFLSKVPYAKSNKSVWQKFVEFVNKLLQNLGVTMEDTALEEALSTFTDLIQFKTTETLLERIYKATEEQLPELAMEVQNTPGITASLRESMSNLVNRKIDDIKQAKANEAVKGMTEFKTKDKKTYYYKYQNGRLSVVRRTKKGLLNVKVPAVINEIVLDLVDSGKIKDVLTEYDLYSIRSLAGDPGTPGSYSSGQMVDDGEIIGDVRFPNAMEIRINLPFKSKEDYARFKLEYFSQRKVGKLEKGSLDKLLTKYNRTAVQQYGELLSLLGSRQNIEILIKKGLISIGDPLNKLTLEDAFDDVSEDELIEMYNFILDGGNLYLSEYSDIRDSINKILSKALGVKIESDLQNKIERKLIGLDIEEELPFETETKEKDLVISSSLPKDPIEDASAYEVTNDDITKTNTAVETNPIRSFYPDGYTDRETGEFIENELFKKYYFKVRGIINALSTKNFEQLSGVHVTLDKDNPLLRWDGSAAELPAELGIVGYLSDDKGNPIIFNKKGERVGVLDRNNLSDTKGLNDGENQIVYFYTLSNPDTYTGKAAKAANPEAFAQLMEIRRKVASGQPQIAALTKVSPGQLNKKALINATNQNRQDTRNEEFYEQLNQPNISFGISSNGYLNAIITAPDGVINRFSLFAPKTRTISIETDDQTYSFADYLIELMRIYKQLEVNNDKRAAKLQDDLVTFVYNMWLTGMDKNIQIPKKLDKIAIREIIKDKANNEVSSLNYYSLFNVVNGVVQINEENAKQIKTYLNNLPINIWKKWLSGEVEFKFPKIETSITGERTIKFVNKNYKDFLFKEVGMKSNVTEIPAQEYLKSYNSIIHFTNATQLDRPITPVVTPSTQDLIDNPNAVQDSVKDKGDDVDLNNEELDALKKRKRFKVPGYSAIFEKICK